MAVEAAPLSVTYPSEHTAYSWWGHPGGFRGGLTGLVVQSSTVVGVEKTQIKPRTPRRWSE